MVSLPFNLAAEFPKNPSPKPARIPPQTPPAGGKSVEAGRIQNPRQIVSPCRVRFNHLDFARNSFELCPTNTASWEMKSLARPQTTYQQTGVCKDVVNEGVVAKIAKALGVPMEDLVK